jgi:signal transduction histidine kinase
MNDSRIIVVAPTGRDGQLICQLLTRSGLDAKSCVDCTEACIEAESGIGALLVADEALNTNTMEVLGKLIAGQPSWSDLPVIVLTGGGQVTPVSEARRKLREPLGNVILIERPVRPETLTSTVESAIRARQRQYQVRDHMEQDKLAADALRKSEKLAVAGRLAASIAHEINNPLEAVTNLHFLMRSSQSLDEVLNYLTIADHELQRVVEITSQTLRFYRASSVASAVNMATVVDSVLKLYNRRLSTNRIRVDRRYRPGAELVGSGGELRQVVANLISNALDAMPNGGTLRIRVGPSAEHYNGRRKGIRVVVADTGVGIPAMIRGKILEPFVSTKQDTGTGLGLWISSEIVRKHGGVVKFRSRVGKGTVFSVFLPARMPQEKTVEQKALKTA